MLSLRNCQGVFAAKRWHQIRGTRFPSLIAMLPLVTLIMPMQSAEASGIMTCPKVDVIAVRGSGENPSYKYVSRDADDYNAIFEPVMLDEALRGAQSSDANWAADDDTVWPTGGPRAGFPKGVGSRLPYALAGLAKYYPADEVRISPFKYDAMSVPYAGAPESDWVGKLSTLGPDLFSFTDSWMQGGTDLAALLRDKFQTIQSMCEGRTKVVLMGYSQGAMVIHRALHLLETGKDDTSALLSPNFIGGVALLADPFRRCGRGGDELGGAVPDDGRPCDDSPYGLFPWLHATLEFGQQVAVGSCLVGLVTCASFLTAKAVASTPLIPYVESFDLPESVLPVTLSYCDKSDIICSPFQMLERLDQLPGALSSIFSALSLQDAVHSDYGGGYKGGLSANPGAGLEIGYDLSTILEVGVNLIPICDEQLDYILWVANGVRLVGVPDSSCRWATRIQLARLRQVNLGLGWGAPYWVFRPDLSPIRYMTGARRVSVNFSRGGNGPLEYVKDLPSLRFLNLTHGSFPLPPEATGGYLNQVPKLRQVRSIAIYPYSRFDGEPGDRLAWYTTASNPWRVGVKDGRAVRVTAQQVDIQFAVDSTIRTGYYDADTTPSETWVNLPDIPLLGGRKVDSFSLNNSYPYYGAQGYIDELGHRAWFDPGDWSVWWATTQRISDGQVNFSGSLRYFVGCSRLTPRFFGDVDMTSTTASVILSNWPRGHGWYGMPSELLQSCWPYFRISVTGVGAGPNSGGYITAGGRVEVRGLRPNRRAMVTVTYDKPGYPVTSASFEIQTPMGGPDVPTDITTSPRDGAVEVSWVAPENNGGSPVTGYRVTSNPSGASCYAEAPATSCIVAGLTNGTAYNFSVQAQNDLGWSDPSPWTQYVQPRTTPPAPTGVRVEPGNGSAKVSWWATSWDGGAPVSRYIVTASSEAPIPGGIGGERHPREPRSSQVVQESNCVAEWITTCTVNGLTNGTAYYFTVRAINAAGSGPSSDGVWATPMTIPGPPTNVSVAPGDGQVMVSWSAPDSDGGSAVTGYYVLASPGGATCSTTSGTSCIVSGLSNGMNYSFTAYAINAVGWSQPSLASNITPRTVPSAPTITGAVPGDGFVKLSWSMPSSNGGVAITAYDAVATPGGATCRTDDTTSCAITGLTNGTTYSFTVTATNAAGLSVPSNSVTATPRTVPGVPTNVSATSGNGSVSVSWLAPVSDGGAPIASYVVTASPGGATCSTSGATACTVFGLTNGTNYSFTVTATNAAGASVASGPVSATPRTVPSAPTSVTAVPGDSSVLVSWSIPVSNGGSVITSYTVTTSPGGASCATTSALTCSVTGLSNGTPYTFTVSAFNAAGVSVASSTVSATPRTVPTAPTGLVATAGKASVLVSWSAPVNDGGAPITSYVVTASPGGATCSTTVATSCTVSGLTNGTSYSFTVAAVNAAGSGPSSAPVSATPRTIPGAPTNVTITAGNGSVSVSWSAPVSNGGAPITGYVVTASPGGATCSTTGATSCTVSGLTNGTSYSFTVTASNVAGSGAPSASVSATPRTVPGAPTNVVAVAGTASVTVSWIAPQSDGGATINGFTATASPGGATCSAVGATSCTVSGLTNGTSYSFTVAAVNAAGSGPSSAPVSATPRTIPGAPTNVTITSGNASVLVSWSAPVSNGGASITGYVVTASPGGATCSTTGATSCTVSGLTNGTSYSFTVTASNVAGSGAPSASVSATPRTVPATPTGVAATPGSSSVVVSWSAPVSDGGAPITSYVVTASPGGATCSTTVATSCTVSGLTNGTSYSFTVAAVNAAGSGPSSAPVSATPRTVPSAPTNVTVASGNASVLVSWSPPVNDGGAPITSYVVTASPGGATCSAVGATSCTVSGLTNGTSYSFTVKASNALGFGGLSTSVSATPRTVPGAPTNVVAVAGTASVTVSWIAPQSDGGAAINGFTATASPGGATCSTNGATSCAISGLSSSASYTFTVTAMNVVGESVASSPSAAVVPLAAVFQGSVTDAVLRLGASTVVKLVNAAPGVKIAVTGAMSTSVFADPTGQAMLTFSATKTGIAKFTATYSVTVNRKTTKYTTTMQTYVPSVSAPSARIKSGTAGKFAIQYAPPGSTVSLSLADGRTLSLTADSAGKATFTVSLVAKGSLGYSVKVADLAVSAGTLTIF